LALAFSAAGLTGAWFTYQGLERPVTIDRPAATGQAAKPAAAPLPAAGQFKMPPMKTFQATLDRPVFSPSRRPKAGAAVVATSQDLAVTLTGISGTSTRPVANLVPQDGGDSVQLRQGQSYRGWTLSEINSKKVVFRRGDDEVQVEMKFEAAPRQVRQRPARPDARQPPGAQRNVRQDRQRQQQNLQQKKQQDRQQQQRNRQQQQNQQQQNQQRQNRQQQQQNQQNQQQQQLQQQQNTQQNQPLN